MNSIARFRKSAVRALRVVAINTGIIEGGFFLVPTGLNQWAVRHKQPQPGIEPKWNRVLLREGTTDLSTFVHVFIREDYSLRRLGRYAEIMGEYRRILQRGRRPLIVDCGANIGLASLYLSLCFPRAYVVGIEPEPGNFSFAANHAHPNITLYRAAFSNADEQLAIANPEASADAFRVESTRESGMNAVPGHSMDSIIAMAKRQHEEVEPFLAKIDIEGFEQTVFSSDTDWIDRFKVVAIELHDWMLPGQGSSRHFLHAVSSRDRDFLYHGDIVFSLRNDGRQQDS